MSISNNSNEKASVSAFSQRLTQACDDNPNIPPYGQGRQVVVANALEVSQEAVRKWFVGLSMPKPKKMQSLAAFLDVDAAWLALGVKPELSRDAKRLAGKVVEGSVMFVAGTIQLAGGSCAFPDPTDPRAGYVDIYAIIKGHKLDIHVTTGKEVSPGTLEFIIPREYADVRCVGFALKNSPLFDLIDMPYQLVDQHKVRRSGDFVITVQRDNDQYMTGRDTWSLFSPIGATL